jgi:peptide/nickel transport system substrate-binding protein
LLAKLLVMLALISLVAAACGGGGDSDDEADGDGGIVAPDESADKEGTPTPGGTMTIGVEAESGGWQPCVDSPSESGTMVFLSVYDQLMARADDGSIKPWLAESLTPSADKLTWTLKLRPNVKFHDGTALDSAVLKSNFDANTSATSRCASALKPIAGMEVVDPLTVKYTLASLYGPFPELLTGAAGMPFSPTNAAAKGADVSSNPVGTGPYIFKSWERDSKLTLEKNPNYWQKGLPYLDTVIVKPIPDEDARLASLSTGEIDVGFTLRQEYVGRAREQGDAIKRYEFVGNNSGATIFNTKRPPVDDKRVRQAFLRAQNQEQIVEVLGGKGITPVSTQFFSKDSPWYSEKVAKAYASNKPEEAKKILAEYQNDPKRSDGKKPGEPVAIQFNCPPDPTLIAYAQAVQQMMTNVGFQVELKQVEQATHINNAVGKPPYTDADYMINCWRLGGQGDPDGVLFNQYGKPENNASNVTNYDNPEVQALLKTARESDDFKTRYDAYEKIHMIFNEDVPHTWSGSTAASVYAKPAYHGITTWKFPDGKSTGKFEQAVIRFAQVWMTK